MTEARPTFLGAPLMAVLWAASTGIAVYHLRTHAAPPLPTLLGQWSLLFATVVFGGAGYYVFKRVQTPAGRRRVGSYMGAVFLAGGSLAGVFGFHQYLSPEVGLPIESILFEMLYIATIGGIAGLAVGYQTVRQTQQFSQIKREQDRFTALFENVPDPVLEFRIDEDVIIEQANAPAREQFDIEPPTTISKLHEQIFHSDRAHEGRDDVARKIVQGAEIDAEIVRQTEEGRRWFRIRTSMQSPTHGFVFYTDFTGLHVREQQLEVLTRVLRHNLRNKLMAIEGYANRIEQRTNDQSLGEEAEQLRESTNAILETTERIQWVRTQIEGDPPTPKEIEITSILESRVLDTRTSNSTVRIDCRLPDSLKAQAHPTLGAVIDALIGLLVKHDTIGEPHLEITLGTDTTSGNGDTAVIEITGQNIQIPDKELVAIGRDPDLSEINHAEGVELWMVSWLVDQFGGIFRTENTNEGITFEIRLELREESSGGKACPSEDAD